jgi:prepilin-type N-terminal cleavage/methylation domain-containing protein
MEMFSKNKKGFALIEVLIAVTITSIVVVSIYRGVMGGSLAIAQNSRLTKAILVAKTKMSEYRLAGMRGTDLSREDAEGYEGFKFSRVTERYENPLFGALPAKKTVITVHWTEEGHERKYSIFTVFIEL